ncbi:TIGR04282 family arsenosugar biosynthesis glycosyltransferase [Psychroserpens sp. BH13MA-6]
MNKKTAILIFAHSAEFEAIQKPFKAAEVLFDALNTRTIDIAQRSGLPYFLFSEKNQIGSTFGERFTNAIQSVYHKGFDNVITIGNDTPHLQSQHILKAAGQLENNAIVLGPSKDGGFYLMGLQKTYFNPNTFLKLPWQTSRLQKSLSKLVAAQPIALSYLELLADIDTVSDAKTISDSFQKLSKHIKRILQQYISVEKKIINVRNSIFETPLQKLLFNKGSPVFVPLTTPRIQFRDH